MDLRSDVAMKLSTVRSRLLLLAASTTGMGVQAEDSAEAPTRHWITRIGIHPLATKPDAHSIFDVDAAVATSLGLTYLFSTHCALEAFVTAPVTHHLSNADAQVAQFHLQPATLTAQYHIVDGERMRVYVAAGVAYAQLSRERTSGPLAAESLRLDHSLGSTAAIGLDLNLGSRWFGSFDARWFDIDSDVRVNDQSFGTLELDP